MTTALARRRISPHADTLVSLAERRHEWSSWCTATVAVIAEHLPPEKRAAAWDELTEAVDQRRRFETGYLEPFQIRDDLRRADRDYDTALDILCSRVDAALQALLPGDTPVGAPCTRCDGVGEVVDGDTGSDDYHVLTCPKCGGLRVQPSDEDEDGAA